VVTNNTGFNTAAHVIKAFMESKINEHKVWLLSQLFSFVAIYE
jgi:hypothetical protein